MNIEMISNNLDLRGNAIPTYEDIRRFMEQGTNDDELADKTDDADIIKIPSDIHDEDRFYKSDHSPPYNKDLLEIMHG